MSRNTEEKNFYHDFEQVFEPSSDQQIETVLEENKSKRPWRRRLMECHFKKNCKIL